MNFNKNFVKYYCKQLKENCACVLKIQDITERRLLLTIWDQFFSVTLKETFAE